MVEEADTATEVAEGTSKSEDTGEVEIQKKDENGVVAMEEDGKTETVKNDLKEEGKKKVEHIDSKDEEEKEEHIDSKEEKEKEEHKVEEENDNKAEGNKMDIDSKEVDENKVEIDNESKEVAESKGLKEEENKDSKEEEDINMEENKVSKKEEENKVEENKDLKEEENKVKENKDPREQEQIMDSKEEVENKNSKEEEETKDSKEEEENGIEEHNDLKAEEGNEREEPHDSKGNAEDEDTSNEENKKADAQVSGEGKRPRKRSYKGEAKEEGKEPTSPVASHIERPVRERKSVERLVASIEKEPAKEFLIPKGRGTALKDIPNVANKLSKKKNDENLKMLHVILFGRRGKASQVRSNISQFNGFVWHENEEKQRLRIKEKLDKLVKEKLLEFCDIFDIAVLKATAKKEDIVTRLLDFLAAPKPASDVLVAEKEESGTTKKRSKVVKRGTPESGGSDAKHSSKKKRKTEGTLKVVENESESGDESDKSDTDGEFDKEDDEERAKNVSDGSEDEVAEHSKSKGKQNDFREESEEEARKQNPSLKGSSAKTTSGKSKPKKETTAKKENSVVSPKMYSTKKRSRDQAEKDEGIGRSGPDGSEDEAAEHSESKGNGNELCEESDEETRKENSVSGRLSAKMISPVEAKPKKKISTANETTVLSPAKSPSVKRFKVNDSSSKSIEVFSRKKKNQETDKAKSPAPLKSTKEIDVKEQSGKKTLKGKDERMKEKSAPTEPELRKVICQILTEVDLNKATFLDILKQLGDRFKMDLEPKKSDIKLMVKEELTKLNDEDDEDEDDESETEMEEQPKSAVRETKRPSADQGKTADPETRCRRSDGKKWRCSKAVVPGEKYCEHHMHRGRKR